MTKTNRKNIAASVHGRLLNKARESNRPFNGLFVESLVNNQPAPKTWKAPGPWRR